MASVASTGASPLSVYDPLLAESTGDDESWAFLDLSGSSNPGSIAFFPSPTSGSLASYGVVGHRGGVQPSPPAPSPLYLDNHWEQAATSHPMQYADHQTASLSMSTAAATTGTAEGQFMTAAHGAAAMQDQFPLAEDFIFDEREIHG